jgi:ABC-type branched-subunit amino acid transport system permease subunit
MTNNQRRRFELFCCAAFCVIGFFGAIAGAMMSPTETVVTPRNGHFGRDALIFLGLWLSVGGAYGVWKALRKR